MSDAVRPARPADWPVIAATTVAAFHQFAPHYADWPALQARLEDVATQAGRSELWVATVDGVVAGSVAYVAPGRPKAEFFPEAWPIIRLLAVAPGCRGRGLGRRLVETCIESARREGCREIGLHTSPIMVEATALYAQLGFVRVRDAPPLLGVPYGVYRLALAAEACPGLAQ